MILELVDILIHPGKQAEFYKAIEQVIKEHLVNAKGFVGYQINKCIESPERYVLMNYCTTLENHTIDFRGSPMFLHWRGVVGPFFARPPVVEHFTILDTKLPQN